MLILRKSGYAAADAESASGQRGLGVERQVQPIVAKAQLVY
jgi:hypothetical protein